MNVEMSVKGRLRFISAFYRLWRYSTILQQTSRPLELGLRLEQMPDDMFFPLLRLSMWSYLLGPQAALDELLNLVESRTSKGRGEEDKKGASTPWMTICRVVFVARARRNFISGTLATCWFDFFEGCKRDSE